ncbi:MAG: hypothetical protein LUH15_06155 [Tannerellaceae bacterium]|nr:hypothetical protein [Tannerellaceae bacterium]
MATFRKTTVGNQVLFEKVYFNSYSDLQNIIWFQQNILPILIGTVRVPNVVKIYKGGFVSVVYFDFLDLKPFENKKEMLSSMIKLSKYLYEISINKQNTLQHFTQINNPFDFRQHFEYKRQREIAKKKLLKVEINFDYLEKQVKESTSIITHGDLYKTNFYQQNMLIDWDTFGIYPVAMEISFFYQRFLETETEVKNDFFYWLKINYKEMVKDDKWNEFERNACFFYIFFTNLGFLNQFFLI